MATVPGRTATRGTWHVPPREGLQKFVDPPTGRTGGTADPKLAGHTYPNLCAFVVAVSVWCRLHAPEAEHFFDMGSSGLRKL